jgi:glycosyltransferase involved in cell wall biosynthesis
LDGLDTSRDLVLQGVRDELDQPVRIARWIAVSEYEGGLMEESGFGPVSVVGHRVTLPTSDAPAAAKARSGILLVGAVHDMGAPNYEGLYWFLTHVAPLIPRQVLKVAGYWTAHAAASIQKQFGDYPVELLGPVDQATLFDLYSHSKLAIAPTRFAAGIPCKVIEAMTYDLPIVITDLLAVQILGEKVKTPDMLAVGLRTDGGASFADWITKIVTDEQIWRSVVECQRAIVREMPGVSDFAERINALLETERELVARNGTVLSPRHAS